MSDYSPDRLDDRFRSLDAHIADLRETIRVFAPLTSQTGVLEAKVEDIEGDIRDMKADVRDLAKETTTLVRENRSERIRQAALLFGPAIALALATVVGIVTGKI